MAARPWYQFYEPGAEHWQPTFTDAVSAFRSAVRSGRGGISYRGRRWAFAEIDKASDSLCHWMQAHNIGAQDRICIILQNVPASAIALIAAWKQRAIPVPGNPGYRSGELARVFADSRPALLICHPEHCPVIREALAMASVTAPILVVSGREHGDHPDSRIVPTEEVSSDSIRLSDVLAAPATAQSPAPVTPSDVGLLLYTSGTTGEPKGAVLRHSSLIGNAELMGTWCGVDASARILAIAPLFHITGIVCHLLMAIAKQCWLILTYRFEANVVLDAIRRERPTYSVGAVTAYNALMGAPGASKADFASFRQSYTGGASVPPALRQAIRDRLGIDLRNSYGMTETCAPTHLTPRAIEAPVDPVSGALSIGIPQWNTDAKIVDGQGTELAAGEIGEIWVSGPQVMAGYWNNPADTAAVLAGGWMRTGDVGFMDGNGWFYIVDRKKDMINASGFKVWPREVEDALYRHPGVREAAVVGEPDDYRGETVVAYVSLHEGVAVEAQELITHCRALLAAYKCPREIRELEELPKTVTGKILRRSLRRDKAP